MCASGVLLCLLLSAAACSADQGSVTLQPWLVGLTAVVGFLLIVFIILIAKRLLRKDRAAEGDDAHDSKVVKEQGAHVKQTSL